MRIGTVATAICLFLFGLASADEASAFARKPTRIPPEALGSALTSVAMEFDLQVLYRTELISQAQTHGASGIFTPDEALQHVLSGTGLTYRYLDRRTVTILPLSSGAESATPAPPRSDFAAPTARETKEGKTTSSDRFRMAQADDAASASAASVGAASPTGTDGVSRGLQEVVVTAEKRSERIQDVPIPVTSISADSLLESNRLQLQDYYTSIPGFSLTPTVQSSMILAIRGITTGPGNPTVGVMIDGVPYGASTQLGGGLIVPDIDPSDLQRVEVLRGPQGTLYGASSLGGLLNFVTTDPSTSGVSGRMEAGTDVVQNGSQQGYSARGSVNLPVSDSVAIRASAFTRRDPGYIDNPVLGIDGINEQRVFGGRLSGLWRPADAFSLKVSALYQEMKGNGSSDIDVEPGLSGLQQSYVRGIGGYDRKAQAYSAIASVKLGRVDMTSVTGYNVNSITDSFDYSYALGPFTQMQFGVTGTPAFDDLSTHKFSQELRLAMPLGARFDGLFGAFYTHEDSSILQDVLAAKPTTGTIVGSWIRFDQPVTFTEYAVFADLTARLTKRFDVQIGGRESRIRQTFMETDTGPYVPLFEGVPSPNVFPTGRASNSAFTYLLTPRFKVTPDLMVYARLASGYRAGGPNQGVVAGVSPQYNPDRTNNYEIGVKGAFLEHRLSMDASVYYIDWKDLQLNLINPQTGEGYVTNGSRAKSQGVELEADVRPLMGLHISGWVSWSDSVLTEDLPTSSAVQGVAGDRLPYSSHFSGNLSLRQDFPLGGSMTGFVGGMVSYVGERGGTFASTGAPPQRQTYPAYARTDASAGVSYESWTINLFVNNVTDRRGVLQGGIGYTPPFGFQYITPRTTGLSVVKTF